MDMTYFILRQASEAGVAGGQWQSWDFRFLSPHPRALACTPFPTWGASASESLLPSMSEMSQLD